MIKGVLTPEETLSLSSDNLSRLRAEGWYPAIAGAQGGGALESNINALWVAQQPAGRGTPASMIVGTKKMRWVGGDLNVARADGTEPYSDGTLFGDTVDFVNTLTGNGAPVVQGQSGILAYLSWLACGQEAVTGGLNAEHSISVTGAPTGGQTMATFAGFGPFAIAWDATAAAVQASMLAAENPSQNQGTLPAGSILCAGGPLPANPITVTFQGSLANQPVPSTSWSFTDAYTGGATPATEAASTIVGTGYTHVATPADTGGFWSSWVKSVGKSVVYRGQFNDARISNLRYEGSSASKVVKATPTLLILDPGNLLGVDPTKADDGTRPFIYTEGQGNFVIDGQVFRGHSAFAIEAQWGLNEWYGDAATPYTVINNRATVVLQGITIVLDSNGLAFYNKYIYGTETPAVGAKPIQTIPALGSYSCTFNRVNPFTGGISESMNITLPSVKWDPNLAIPANPAGGAVEFPLAGEYRKVAGQPAFTVTVTTPNDIAYSS